MRDFLKRITLLLACCVFTLGNAHVSFADDLTLMEAFFSQKEGYSGWIEVPGKGKMRYYAQNDPLWGALTYEKGDTESRRPFRDSGCSPSSAAMAVAALIPESELCLIADYAKRPYSLCSCSLNKERCNKHHDRYLLTSVLDFNRFLPLIFGDFATGNNIFGAYSRSVAAGTGTGYLHQICKIYDLQLNFTYQYAEALAALDAGKAVVALAGSGGAFTDTGHYVFLAHYDNERLYVLDPLRREVYKTNGGSKLEIIEPGLVSLLHDRVSVARFSNFLIFEKITDLP